MDIVAMYDKIIDALGTIHVKGYGEMKTMTNVIELLNMMREGEKNKREESKTVEHIKLNTKSEE